MPRIANKDFKLNVGAAALLSYKAGDVIDKAHEEHWWAKAHSDEQRKLSKNEQAALDKAHKAVADAEVAYNAATQASEADKDSETKLTAAIKAGEDLDAARAALAALTKE
ncbi:MAG: hypothetical protein Q8S92_22775 [Hydrogenophaga sp.]|uniref:hypothetical protein n=1 Tax=Hydrogenophaga sp. TaxID=1904254 RepID=UPI00273647A4|nr:hypothetical protein [Hydrogenophaga sp.]MDP3351820.1 hypothetical protein [Hydrogenophaga sp.]